MKRLCFPLIISLLFYCSQTKKNKPNLKGYVISENLDSVSFVYSPKAYNTPVRPGMKVFIAGSFNDWGAAKYKPYWFMTFNGENDNFESRVPIDSILTPGASNFPEFKFVVFPSGWQDTKNIPSEYKKGGNLWINLNEKGDHLSPMLTSHEWINDTTIKISFNEPLAENTIKIDNFNCRPQIRTRGIALSDDKTTVFLTTDKIDLKNYGYLSPFQISIKQVKDLAGNEISSLDSIQLPFNRETLNPFFAQLPFDDSPLGMNREGDEYVFRIFAPRARRVDLLFYQEANDENPAFEIKAKRKNQSLWEAVVPEKIRENPFYLVRLNNKILISDPYSKANIYSSGKSAYIETGTYPWKDQDFITPRQSNLIIYETHIVNLTYLHPRVPKDLKGKFIALADTASGSPLSHLKDLGINTVELYPSTEIANGNSPQVENNYDWGYMPALYFAPETDYISKPLELKHLEELRETVNTLHENGMAVILDVVYNHTSLLDCPLMKIDEAYYYTGSNYSGCGNDLNCERPYTEKLILDNMKYLTREAHIDGFRFDMAHLIEMPAIFTKETIEELNEIKPTEGNVILIGEHWGSDESRTEIAGRGIGQWNATFRERIKRFLTEEKGNRDVYSSFRHTYDKPWFGGPKEVVNYLESHDEETLVHYLREHIEDPALVMKKAKIGAFILMFSAGSPMMLEAMEMARNKSKQSQDLPSNQVDWKSLNKNKSIYKLYRSYIKLRKKLGIFSPSGHYDEKDIVFEDTKIEGLVVIHYEGKIPPHCVIINNTNKPRTLTLQREYNAIIADENGTYDDSPKPLPQTDLVESPPYSCRILTRN